MPSDSQKKALARASETYHAQLGHALNDGSLPSGVSDYFKSHKIDRGIMRKYELGYVASPLPGDERFQGMICIPYLSPTGVVAIKYRNVVADASGKYAQQHGQKGRLYNAGAYFTGSEVIGVCEGEMDAIAATEHLGIPALGVPGANGWREEWALLLKDFRKVFVFADGDLPGKDFAYSVIEKVGWRAQMVQCPDGEDVCSLAAADRLGEITTSIMKEAA